MYKDLGYYVKSSRGPLLSRLYYENGYCPVQEIEVTIGIVYYDSQTLSNRSFLKHHSTACNHHDDTNCTLHYSCPVWKEAPSEMPV